MKIQPSEGWPGSLLPPAARAVVVQATQGEAKLAAHDSVLVWPPPVSVLGEHPEMMDAVRKALI